MSDSASSFSFSSQELKDDVSRGRIEQRQAEAVDGLRASVSSRGTILSFKRVGGSDEPREVGGPVSQDQVAHPACKTRAEGAADPTCQFGEEPPQGEPLERTDAGPSEKTELDIRAFVEAVEAAFPKPRDPQMARVIPNRPERAARTFFYLAEEQEPGHEIPAKGQRTPQADLNGATKQRAETSRKEVHRNLDVLLYDPILEGPLARPEKDAQTAVRVANAKPKEVVKAAVVSVWTPGMPDRRSRKREPVQAHERTLIEAVIDPLDPVAKPRLLPVLNETLPGVPARLSPFQRAQLQRPKTVRDCHGRITPVEYRHDPADSK